MTRETWAVTCFVVSVVMMIIGVRYGLAGDHETAVPAVLVSLLSLLLGATLIRR